MKKALLVLLILINIQTLAFAKTILETEKCNRLAGDVSIVAFSPDTNGLLYSAYQLNKGKGVDFINQTRRSLATKMKDFCSSGKVTIEDFYEKFHGACSMECQDQSAIFKDSILSAKKTEADTVCLSICNGTSDKINMLMTGIELGKKENKSESADCSGGVDSSKRSSTKTTIFDGALEPERSFNKGIEK